jgi:hypothetical protein
MRQHVERCRYGGKKQEQIELSRADRMPEWKSSRKVKRVVRFRVTLIRL